MSKDKNNNTELAVSEPSAKTSKVRKSFDALAQIREDFTEDQKKFIMESIAPGLNQNELLLFLLKCSVMGLNPLLGEVTGFVAKNDQGQRQLVVIAGRDGKRRAAYNTGKVENIITKAIYVKKVTTREQVGDTIIEEETTVPTEPWDGHLWGAVCTIKRTDREDPTTVQVPLSEYHRQNRVWKSKPETMIKKVAQSQALSEAFPEILGGTYDESEQWSEPVKQEQVLIDDGHEPVTKAQLETLKALGYEGEEPTTKQQAIDSILELQENGGKNASK